MGEVDIDVDHGTFGLGGFQGFDTQGKVGIEGTSLARWVFGRRSGMVLYRVENLGTPLLCSILCIVSAPFDAPPPDFLGSITPLHYGGDSLDQLGNGFG